VASHELIDDHLRALADHLPPETVAELADGLIETWQRHLEAGRSATEAARTAIAEFGDPDQVVAAFTAAAPGRRTARFLLGSGPLVGACWGASLISGRAWEWPLPALVPVGFATALLLISAALATAASSRRHYRRTRLGGLGGAGLVVLDLATVAAVVLISPAFVWPMALAIPASLARAGLTLRALPTALAR